MFFNDALDDLPDRVPTDPQQARDRGLGHLLRQPRHDILEVAGVVRVSPGPWHDLQANTAVRAAQTAQLALDHAAGATEIQVAPALAPMVVDLKMGAGLPAARAHPPTASEPHGHDHPLAGEAHVDDRRSGKAQQPVECRGDAHVVLLARSLAVTASSLHRGRLRVAEQLRNLREPPDSAETQQAHDEHGLSGRYFTPKRRGDPPFVGSRPCSTAMCSSSARRAADAPTPLSL